MQPPPSPAPLRAQAAARRCGGRLGILCLVLLLAAPALSAEVFFSPGGGIRPRLLAAIGGARESVDVAVFHFTSFALADALAAARARGVRVRVLTDGEKLRSGGGAYRILERGRVPLRALGAAQESLMHHKFALFDGRLLATGSYNWTQSAETANHENLVVLDDPDLVARFAREFERLWRKAKE